MTTTIESHSMSDAVAYANSTITLEEARRMREAQETCMYAMRHGFPNMAKFGVTLDPKKQPGACARKGLAMTDEAVLEAAKAIQNGKTIVSQAKRFNVSPDTIYRRVKKIINIPNKQERRAIRIKKIDKILKLVNGDGYGIARACQLVKENYQTMTPLLKELGYHYCSKRVSITKTAKKG